MDTENKEALALTRDMSKRAAAIRLIAARLAIGMGQEQLAQDMGEGMTKQKIGNAERGANFPPPMLMRYFHRQHRIDFNFLMHGDFSQLPLDVQSRLFATLASAHDEWDRKQRSDRASTPPRSAPLRT